MQSDRHYVFMVIPSPVGRLKLVANDDGLSAVLWEADGPRRVPWAAAAEAGNHPVLARTQEQLDEYFAGGRTAFTVELNFVGTAFQKKVWTATTAIPFGSTRSYGDIARTIGSPGAVRAVGAANGKNPIAVIGPCHRVIGGNGKLTGYAGGVRVKAFLLDLESARSPAGMLFPEPLPLRSL